MVAIQSHLQAPPVFHFPVISITSVVSSSIKSWTPQSHPWVQIILMILTSFHESQIFLTASRKVNTFRNFFNWYIFFFLQIHQMNPLSTAVIALQQYFLNNKTWKSKLLLDMGYRIDVMLAEWKQRGSCTSVFFRALQWSGALLMSSNILKLSVNHGVDRCPVTYTLLFHLQSTGRVYLA